MSGCAGQSGTLQFRPVAAADSQCLLNWLNSADSLRWKRQTQGPVTVDDHEAWLAKRLLDPGTFMWLVERDGKALGQARLQRAGNVFKVDVYVESRERQSGLASELLRFAVQNLWQRHPDAVIAAEIYRENAASRRLFERLGFLLVNDSDGWCEYRLKNIDLGDVAGT